MPYLARNCKRPDWKVRSTMSTAMLMNPAQPPHRKPVPGRPSYNMPQQQPYQSEPSSRVASMSRAQSGSPSMASMTSQQPQYNQPARRTPSNATSSASSMNNNNASLQRVPTNASAAPRRSTSSRSNNSSASPTSYVALMRKQKATVWCDRAQAEDPRILAAQRTAKMRAAMEVAGGQHRFSTSSNNATTSSTGIRSKIRHHGAPKASTYTGQANLAGAGVPMRLSASEVDENDSDEEDSKYVNHYHNRNGSRNSSMGSNAHRYTATSNNSTPRSNGSPSGSMGDVAEEETPMPNDQNLYASDYLGAGASDEMAEASFGGVSGLPQRTGPPTDVEKKTAEDLRRRGSVDERNMSMTTTKLFIANPDMDSD